MPFQRLQKFHWFQKKRFGLSVLNHMITSNHVHLLIRDTGPNVIADSMQLIAGPYRQDISFSNGGPPIISIRLNP